MELGRLEQIDLHEFFDREDIDATEWVSGRDNLALLAKAIGTELELQNRAKDPGGQSSFFVCRDVADGSHVLAAVQLGRTDDARLGRILAAAAGPDPTTVIWIAGRIAEEQRAALEWLNQVSYDDVRFFGLQLQLWRIGESSPAPRFEIVVRPATWPVSSLDPGRRRDLSSTRRLNIEYWEAFRDFLEDSHSRFRLDSVPQSHWVRFGIGHESIHLRAAIDLRFGRIAVFLDVSGDGAQELLKTIERDRDAIARELGFAIELRRGSVAEKGAAVTHRRANPVDRRSWPDLHAWTLERLEAFDRCFRERVRGLRA